jgi:hypothetical protein
MLARRRRGGLRRDHRGESDQYAQAHEEHGVTAVLPSRSCGIGTGDLALAARQWVLESDRHQLTRFLSDPLGARPRKRVRTNTISAARLTQGVPWLCVPPSREICLFRLLVTSNMDVGEAHVNQVG